MQGTSGLNIHLVKCLETMSFDLQHLSVMLASSEIQ